MIARTSLILVTIISFIGIFYIFYSFNKAIDGNLHLTKNEYKSPKTQNFRHILGKDDDDEENDDDEEEDDEDDENDENGQDDDEDESKDKNSEDDNDDDADKKGYDKHPKPQKENQLATVQIITDTSKRDNSKSKKPRPEELEAEHEVFKLVGIGNLNQQRKGLKHIEGHHHYKHVYQRQITFAVCCIGSMTSMTAIIPELKSVFGSSTIQSLQKATASCAECMRKPRLNATNSSDPNAKKTHLTTTFRTDDIKLTFDHKGPSLIVTYTLFGNKQFLDAFVKELKLHKNRLEIGIMTTIDSYVPDADSSLIVKWINMDIGELNDDMTDDTRILTMSMQELQGLMDIKLTIAEKLLRASKLKKRESFRAKVLLEERNALDLIIRAAKGQQTGISKTSLTLVEHVDTLKSNAQIIKDKISALDDTQRELEDIIEDDRYQIDLYSRTYHKNEQMVHEFDEKLSLLHRRRIKVIGKIKKLVDELQKQMEKIQSFIGYLSEKKQMALVGHGRLNEKAFTKKDNFTFVCNDTEINLICDQRTIFCKTKLDIFNQSGVTADIKVNITRPKVMKGDYEIVVMANRECEQPLLRRDVIIKPVTVHKCKAEEKECQLKQKGLKKIFGDTHLKSMAGICVFVKCDSMEIDNFDIDTNITIKLKKKGKKNKNDNGDDSGNDGSSTDDGGNGEKQGLNVKVIKGKVPKDKGGDDDNNGDNDDSGGDDDEKGSGESDEEGEDDEEGDGDGDGDEDGDEDGEDSAADDKKDDKKKEKIDKTKEKEKKKEKDYDEEDSYNADAADENNDEDSYDDDDDTTQKKKKDTTSSPTKVPKNASLNLETTSAMITSIIFTIGALMISMLLILK